MLSMICRSFFGPLPSCRLTAPTDEAPAHIVRGLRVAAPDMSVYPPHRRAARRAGLAGAGSLRVYFSSTMLMLRCDFSVSSLQK